MAIVTLERFLTRRFGGVRAGWRVLVNRRWLQRLDRLAGYLVQLKEAGKMDNLRVEAPADQPIVIMTRDFDAPRALVWKVMTEPRHIARWWGGPSYTEKVVVATYEARVGGRWRFESHGKDGNVYVFHGEFREIDPPAKVVQTFGMEGMFEGQTIVETLTLEELPDGRTRYRNVSHYDSIEARDGMVASGMEDGARESLDQLEALLAELSQQSQQQQ